MLVALLAILLWVIRHKHVKTTSAEAAQNVFTVVYRLGNVIIKTANVGHVSHYL